MQDVNELYRVLKSPIFGVLIFLIAVYSCNLSDGKLIPTANNGGYKIEKFVNEGLIRIDSVVIFGQIRDVETNEAITQAYVSWYCQEAISSTDGNYKFKIQGQVDISSYFTAKTLGYRTLETKMFKTVSGDSIRLDFLLEPDYRPIMHCDTY
ncbi:hypothetical protein [Roseivirga echinicomitans]